jgi:hypothetical protein
MLRTCQELWMAGAIALVDELQKEISSERPEGHTKVTLGEVRVRVAYCAGRVRLVLRPTRRPVCAGPGVCYACFASASLALGRLASHLRRTPGGRPLP